MSTDSPSFFYGVPNLSEELTALEAMQQYRYIRTVPPEIRLNLSSNDYLALSSHPRVVAAAQAAAEQYGCGAGASRLVCGNHAIHEILECRLAALTGMPAALVFPSGYQGNLAVTSTLAGPEDIIFSDALNHASLIDGCRLSRAAIRVYRHADAEHLDELLREASGQEHRRRIILSDTLFSMDGDLAPVKELHALARRFEAILIVDEAHALGVFGRGSGVCRAAGVRPHVILGTLSKALGSAGGFVAAEEEVINYLINKARPFIFSTGLSPMAAAAAAEALQIVEEQPELGQELLDKAECFRRALREAGAPVIASSSQIVPVMLGTNESTLQAAAALEAEGILAVAIRPPTVPSGTARLRLSVTSGHNLATLSAAAKIIGELSTSDTT